MKEKNYKTKNLNNSVRCSAHLNQGSNWQKNLGFGSDRVYKIQIKLGGEL